MKENEIILVDGVEYSYWSPRIEDELESSVKHHSKKLFGSNCVYFDIKTSINSSMGLRTIPDAYLIDFSNNAFYIIEIELSKHPEYDHINKQIGRFIGALGNHQSRQKIARILKEYIESDIILKKFVSEKIGKTELYQFFLEDILEKVKEQKYNTFVVIDEATQRINEACNILNPRPKIIEFRTFVRKNVGNLSVHCHLFEPLVSDKKKIDKTRSEAKYKTGHKDYTSTKPEKIRVFKKTIEISHWRQIAIYVAEELIKNNPVAFSEIADSDKMKGGKWTWLSKNRNLVYKPHQLSNGLFLHTNLNANRLYKNILIFLNGCGYKETDIEIFLRD